MDGAPAQNLVVTRFARNTAFSSIAGLASALGALISATLAARLLGAAGAGSVVYVLWLAMVAAAIGDLGISACLTRFLPELTGRREAVLVPGLVRYLLPPALFAAVAVPIAFALVAKGFEAAAPSVVPPSFDAATWILLVALCVAQTLSNFVVSALRGLQRFDRVASATLAAMLVQIVLVACGAARFGALGAFGGYVAGALCAACLLPTLPCSRAHIPQDLRRRVRRHAAFTWAANLSALLVWSRVEIVFLKHGFGDATVGLFSVGLTLSSLAVQGPLLLTGGILAFFSERMAEEDRPRVDAALNLSTRLVAALILPLSFGLCALIPELVPLLYGPQFATAAPSAIILVAAAGLGAVGSVASNLVLARERSDVIFYCNIAGGALSVLGGVILIPHFGLLGAAGCRAVVQLAMLAAGFRFVISHLRFRLPLTHLVRLTFASLACAAGARATLLLVPGPTGLLPAILCGALVYVSAVRLLGALPAGDLERLAAAFDRAPPIMSMPVHTLMRLLVRP